MIVNFNDHAANERTFLAWVRTAMALVGFGLAIGHIGGKTETPLTAVVLVGAGIIVVLLAFVRMHLFSGAIDDKEVMCGYRQGMHTPIVVAMMGAMFVLVIAFALNIV